MNADSYFADLSKALRAAEIHQPCLVLDLDRLNHNIAAVKARFAQGVALRIVDKSLPSLPLLAHIRSAFPTDRFMSFHLPISAAVLNAFPDADLMLGKPMPVAGVRHALRKRRALAKPRAGVAHRLAHRYRRATGCLCRSRG